MLGTRFAMTVSKWNTLYRPRMIFQYVSPSESRASTGIDRLDSKIKQKTSIYRLKGKNYV